MSDDPQTRQLVICCDGTNNNLTGRLRDTNVVKLCQLFADDTYVRRLLFYDPGVGNPGEMPGATLWDDWRRRAERIAGLAFGRGVYENIAECYLFLMRTYRPGDQIYVFGFSRGAFTARSVAGLINQFGVLLPQMESLVPTLMHLYFSDREAASERIKNIGLQATALFADQRSRRVEIQYVGVWDTVASVGMWPFAARFTAIPTIAHKRFLNVRHALALDEHRAQFRPRLYVDNNGSVTTDVDASASIKQLWFRGAHCDVGGGYAEGGTAISDAAFAWLVSEAVKCGLRLRSGGVALDSEAAVTTALAATYPATTSTVVHSELFITPLWALTGMAVRDTARVQLDDGSVRTVVPEEHSSVAASSLQMPADSVWRGRRPTRMLWLCLAAIPAMVIALGELLTGPMTLSETAADVPGFIRQIPEFLQSYAAFARWQLTWWLEGVPTAGIAAWWAPRWAVVWDVVLIGLYGYVLAWFAAAAFERHAGLRRAGDPVSRALAVLGWALPLTVFADLAENVMTWATLTLSLNDVPVLALGTAVAMTLLSLAKWVGLIGVVLFCALPSRVFRRSG